MQKKETQYAVIKIGGRQYKVVEGDQILVDKLSDNKPEAKVLLLVKGEDVKIGKPYLEKEKVILKLLKQEKGEKIDIYKYKAKSRYRRHIGFRPQYSQILIEKILS